MASLTLDYTGDFTTKKGNTYSWDLYIVDGDGLNASITNSTQEFIQTTWDASEGHEWSTIWASETRLTFYDTDAEAVYGDLIQNLTENLQRGARLNIRDSSGNTVWLGWANLGDLAKQEDGLGELTVTFTDGLGALEDVPFVPSTTNLNPYEGRVTFISLLATILGKTGFVLPFYVASDMYPRATTTQLLATECPLEGTFVDRYRFRNKDAGEGETEYIDTLTVLKEVMARWGCSIRQSGGQWHIIQNDLLYGSSYRRWYYDSNGTPTDVGDGNVYEDVNPRVTSTDDTMARTPGAVSLLDPYDAVAVDYQHGLIMLLRDPGFDKSLFDSVDPNPSDYRWIKTGAAGVRINVASGDNLVAVVPSIKIALGGSDWPTIQGTSAGSWDALVQDNLATTGYWTTQCQNLLTAGSQILASAVFRPVKDEADAVTPAHPIRRAMAQVRIYDGTTTRYLDAEGGWVSPVNWIYATADAGQTTFAIGRLGGSDALPATSSVGWQVFISLGPIVELQVYTGSGGGNFSVDSIWWDEARVDLVLPDGTANHERTVTTNYVGDNASSGRVNPRVFDWPVHLGDGPVGGMDASITMDAEGTDITSDWKEGAITGVASGDSMSELQSRMLLRAVRNPREVLGATYFNPPSAVGPISTIYREGAAYAPLTLTRDWNDETFSGSWIKLRQDGFTDDLETGLFGISSASGFGGGNGQAGLIMSQLATTFFSPASKRVAATSAVLAAGARTSLTVSEMTDPILSSGDRILLVAPNLNYYELVVSANQLAGATSIAINSYTFPEEVPYPASVFFREDDLLALVRLGEQGFAITVKGENAGAAAETINATVTDLNVSAWIASIPSGSSVFIVDDAGTEQELTLTADAPKGSVNIQFSSLALDVTSGAAIKANSTVSRSEFIQTSTKIEQYIESEGNLLGTVSGTSTDTTIPIDSLTFDLKSGDKVMVRSASTGTVLKREVNGDFAAGVTSITVTASTIVASGDLVVASQLAGLRIEMDGIEVLETSIGSQYTAGSAGWQINNDGSAEFNNVTVRGTVILSSGSSGIANFSDAGGLAVQDDVDFDSDVTGSEKPANNATVGATWGTNLGSIPATLGTPSGAGLYLSSTHLGYYNSSAWKTYMDSSGNFYLGGTSGSLQWDGSTLTIVGGGTFSGALSAATGDFKGSLEVGTNAWHVDTSGNMWWGSSASYAGATIKISAAGSVNMTTGVFSGSITGASGSFSGLLDAVTGSLGALSVTGALTISGAGSLTVASGPTIDASGIQMVAGTGGVNAITWGSGGTAGNIYKSTIGGTPIAMQNLSGEAWVRSANDDVRLQASYSSGNGSIYLEPGGTGGIYHDGNLMPAAPDIYYSGGADVAILDGGTGASTATVARTNLGLGNMATESYSAFAPSGFHPAVGGTKDIGTSIARWRKGWFDDIDSGGTIDGHDFDFDGGGTIAGSGESLGFFGATPDDKPEISGSRGSNAALASLLTGLATLGLITDSSS